MTNDELITYYVNLLIIQYNSKPRARDTVRAFVTESVASQVISNVNEAFDLETATGAQLDIIGKYVGINRVILGFVFDRDFFAMPSYDDANPENYIGFSVYGDTPESFFAQYGDESNRYRMNDQEMRAIIKMKILQNKSNHSLADIDIIMDTFFADGCLVTDNEDMTITYDFTNMPAEIMLHKIAIYTESLPRPAGVELILEGV
jgi:hypothetical protein